MCIISSVSRICIFLQSYSFDIETTRVNTLSQFPRKPYPIPDQNGQSVFPFSVQIVPNTLSFGPAHTYMAQGSTPPPLPNGVINLRPDRPHNITIPGSEQLFLSVERHRSSKRGTRYCTSMPKKISPLPYLSFALPARFLLYHEGYLFPLFV